MAGITFTSDHLRKLLRVNSYPYSETKLMVFGIRGAKAISNKHDSFGFSHTIELSNVNYLNPNCIIGIWNPVENKIALFAGSTVPNLKFIKKQKEGTGRANAMQSGFYSYFEKGYHNPGPNSAHQALRLATNIMLRRSNDDLVFTNEDPVEVGNPNDNIHAAYCDDTSGNYSSAGCQVIVGQPKNKARNFQENTGYWKTFFNIIYKDTPSQSHFDYCLFRFTDIEAVAINTNGLMEARLRFGSKGNSVLELQQKLKDKGYYNTSLDGEFGRNTLFAVLAFQKATFGADEADGVVGKNTAAHLGFTLPLI
jgi:hypothetical protein